MTVGRSALWGLAGPAPKVMLLVHSRCDAVWTHPFSPLMCDYSPKEQQRWGKKYWSSTERGWGKKTPGCLNNSQSTPKTVKRFPREVLCTPEAEHRTRRRNTFHAHCPRKYTEWSVRWRKETQLYNPLIGWELRSLGLTLSLIGVLR